MISVAVQPKSLALCLQSIFVASIMNIGSLMFGRRRFASINRFDTVAAYLQRYLRIKSIKTTTSKRASRNSAIASATNTNTSAINLTASLEAKLTVCYIRLPKSILTNLHNGVVGNIIDLGSLMFCYADGLPRKYNGDEPLQRLATAVLSYQVNNDHEQLHGFSRKHNHKCEKYYSFSHIHHLVSEACTVACNIRLPKSLYLNAWRSTMQARTLFILGALSAVATALVWGSQFFYELEQPLSGLRNIVAIVLFNASIIAIYFGEKERQKNA